MANPPWFAVKNLTNRKIMQQGISAAEMGVSDAKVAAQGRADRIKQAAAVKIKEGKQKAKHFHGQAEDYVREHPTKCVLGALGVGLAIGLIIRR